METSTELIEMDKSSINILNLLELVKNSDLVQKISDLKGKVIIDEVLNNLSNQFSKFTGGKYNWRNNVELTGIPHTFPDVNLENTVVNICKDCGIDVEVRDIDGRNLLPLSRTSRGHDK